MFNVHVPTQFVEVRKMLIDSGLVAAVVVLLAMGFAGLIAAFTMVY
jgi:hypothetical protein